MPNASSARLASRLSFLTLSAPSSLSQSSLTRSKRAFEDRKSFLKPEVKNEKGGLRREVCEEQRWLAVTTNPICICLLFLAKMACCDRNFLFVILLYFCYAVIFRLALHQYRFVVCCFFCLLYAAYLVRVYILCDFLICYLVYCVFGLCYDFEVKNCMTTALWGLGLFTLRCLCTFFADSLTCRGTVWLHFFCCVFETFMVISLCHSCVFLCLLYGVYLLCARF